MPTKNTGIPWLSERVNAFIAALVGISVSTLSTLVYLHPTNETLLIAFVAASNLSSLWMLTPAIRSFPRAKVPKAPLIILAMLPLALNGCASFKSASRYFANCTLDTATDEGIALVNELDSLTAIESTDWETKGKQIGARVGWDAFKCAVAALAQLVKAELENINNAPLPTEQSSCAFMSVRVSVEAQKSAYESQLGRLNRLYTLDK